MKRCPECRRDYHDDTLLYCLEDGVALVQGSVHAGGEDEPQTAILHDAASHRDAETPAQIHTAEQTAELSKAKALDKRLLVAPFALAAIVLSVFLAYRFFEPSGPNEIEAVAVLPFANDSGDSGFDYLSDGLSESLIDRLAQLPQIRVIARTSSFRYRGNDINLQDVADALGVQAIIIGRVVQRGENLSVRVEMIDVRHNRQMWSDSYSRSIRDIQALQGEIAKTVSEKLLLRLSDAQARELAKTATPDSEAYRLYLNGMYNTRGGMKASLDYFLRASHLDPNFALAFYRVGWCYYYLGYNSELDPKETNPKARTAVLRALEIDGTLAEAHLLMAAIKEGEWDWSGAAKEIDRVIELSPNTASSHSAKARRFAAAGRLAEAVAESRIAQKLDPLTPGIRVQGGSIYYHARRFDEAIPEFQEVIRLFPDKGIGHTWLAYTYAAKGMYIEAIAEYQRAAVLHGENSGTSDRCYLGYALARSGRHSEATAIFNELISGKEYVSPAELAILHLGLGDEERAFQALERAFAERDLLLKNIKKDPHYDSLHNDPRFDDLVRRIGLQ